MRSTVDFAIGVIQIRVLGDSLHDGPSHEMRKRNFALTGQRPVLIENAAIVFDDLDRDDAMRSGNRHRQRCRHVLGALRGGALAQVRLAVTRRASGSFYRSIGYAVCW